MKKQPIPRPDALITLPRKTIGRPSRLTDEVASKVLMAIKSGSFRGVAAEWSGVPQDEFFRWMGMKGEPYETFQRLVREAEAHAELRAVTKVTADEDAKMAVAFLERRFPVRWARAMPSTNVTLDLGSMLEQIHRRIATYKDPREARRALTAGDGVQVLDVEGRPLPHDPRPPRDSVTQPVKRQPVTVLPPALRDEPREPLYDGEHDVDAVS